MEVRARGEAVKKKNFVVFLSAQDSPSFVSFVRGRRMVVRIKREGVVRRSKYYCISGASRRRMLRVLEAM